MKLVLMSGVAIDEALVRDATQAGFDACIDKSGGARPLAPPHSNRHWPVSRTLQLQRR
jgi:hypothetical protein